MIEEKTEVQELDLFQRVNCGDFVSVGDEVVATWVYKTTRVSKRLSHMETIMRLFMDECRCWGGFK